MPSTPRLSSLAVPLALGLLLASSGSGRAAPPPGAAPAGYAEAIARWRANREARLRADDGWLTVAGLFWLKPGPNRFGSAKGSDIVVPGHSAPAHAGVFHLKDGEVTVEAAPGVPLTLDGQPVRRRRLGSDRGGARPDVLALGALRFFAIERGGRLAIRMRDLKSDARRRFRGLRWYPVRPDYRVTARFVPHATPKHLAIPNVLGQVERMPSPGTAVFRLAGRELRLDAVQEPGDKELFFIFRDRTSGRTTYGAGRFLYAPAPTNGETVLDFNKAYTPPCGFTRFATCPLPPRQNWLPLAIEAGEQADPH